MTGWTVKDEAEALAKELDKYEMDPLWVGQKYNTEGTMNERERGIEAIRTALQAARESGARDMRERAAKAIQPWACGCGHTNIGRSVAAEVRALPLDSGREE